MEDNKPSSSEPVDKGATVRAPAPEVVFNRYDLLSELGKGGMGVVWLALDRELNSRVALKFLREEMTSEDHALKELKGEVLINRDLAHPNIIKTFDFVADSRRSAISMEFVDGTNLHKLKTQRPEKFFEVEDIKAWVFQLCDAMHYAHQQKVVHRDIKPANLMVNDRGEMKLGDFGIGRTVADTVNRVTRNTAGTPPFMSPQQTMGEKSAPADDIYSISATVYDLLTGEPPFFRGSIREQTLGKVPPSMTERRKELGRNGSTIPAHWEQAVAAGLAKEASARPATARALRELLEGKTAEAPRRNGLGTGAWIGIAAAGLAVAAGGGYFLLKRPAPVEPPPQVRTLVGRPSPAPIDGSTVQPSTSVPASIPASAPVTMPTRLSANGMKTPVDDLIDAGGISAEEGATLSQALRSAYGDAEKVLATRLLIDHSLQPDNWRAYTSLAPTDDPVLEQLRPLLAAGTIKENEFSWLRAAMAGLKGDPEQKVANQFLNEKTLPAEQWRTQTDLYPQLKRDPLMEKINPMVTNGALTKAEGQWLRDALAGEKTSSEKGLAAQLVDDKTLKPGQWRAKTAFDYALKDDAEIDGAHLPTAVDLPIGAKMKVRLLRVDPGSYSRGSPRDELGRRANELAPERIEVSKPFYIAIFEVTQAQFESLMPRSPSFWRNKPGLLSANWPIDQVTWQDVMGSEGFIGKLNRTLSSKYGGALVADLPTEEEWEYAGRGGADTPFNNWKMITNIGKDAGLDPLANYGGAETGSPKNVGSYQPNDWGLYDMHGNVMEWCKDKYQRGGHWQSRAADCRIAARTQSSTDAGRSNKVGFRLVLRYRAPGTGN